MNDLTPTEHQTDCQRDIHLLNDLLHNSNESYVVEFKRNNENPEMIGKLISALSNAARLKDKDFAYVLWGVDDARHHVLGTTFSPMTQKVGNQDLSFRLAQVLKPSIPFAFREANYHGQRMVLLEIPAAPTHPVAYDGCAYIRIASATPPLSQYPEYEQLLWRKIQSYQWENDVAKSFVDGDGVLSILDYPRYFELTEQPLPDNRQGIFERLMAERVITRDVGEYWNITNLGAILFAKRFDQFPPSLARKAIRFVAYDGDNRACAVTHRQDGVRGYASGFDGLLDYVHTLLPRNEHIGIALRESKPLYPSIAIRELVANAIIHQDMTVTGAGPLIEMFSDRIELTNPGLPLVQPERFLDFPPRSRNEVMAALMRRMRFCEEQGTGIDKVLSAVELYQLPPPDFRVENESVRVILYAPRQFADMTPEERMRACYQHASLLYVSGGQKMKNTSLCQRFNIDLSNAAQATRVIKQTIQRGLIRPADSEHPRAGYVPFWA